MKLLVQLAHTAGARLIAAAGSEQKLALAKRLGADDVVDYTKPGWADRLPAVDVVFDGVGRDIARTTFELLRPGERFCAYGLASGTFPPSATNSPPATGSP